MNKIFFTAAFAIGLGTVTWVGLGFVGSSWLALVMTAVIAGVYGLGALELSQFRSATDSLAVALADMAQPVSNLGDWLQRLHPSLQNAARSRIEGERVALPGPALTPYLVGLLVMLGMLGTFLGMVVTFKGAVFALEGSTDLQAIRSALAAPIKGLGLSFGTSVAGVAASAMLGLMSALSRRERAEGVRLLDTRIASAFRPFSLVYQRQEAFKALQVQAHALPDVVEKLHAMITLMEHRGQQLDAQLVGQQAQFHREVRVSYNGLAQAVGTALTHSLTAAGESLKPVVEAAMTGIAGESQRVHERLSESARAQVDGLSAQFSATARTVSDSWAAALQHHARTSDGLVTGLDRALAAFAQRFEQRSGALLTTVSDALARAQSDHALADQHRLATWMQSFEALATGLHSEWQRSGAQTLAQQQAITHTLEKTASEINERSSAAAHRTLEDIQRLLSQSEALVQSRTASEAYWAAQQEDRMSQLTQIWHTEMVALRDAETVRGHAAVDRLGELQAAMTGHLATLGAALEAPLTRLLQTSAEVPQAAAAAIAHLRQEMVRLTERDNLALEDRAGLLDNINTLLKTLNHTSGEQHTAVASLVATATTLLEKTSSQAAQALEAQSGKTADVAAHVASSAVELASLGEAFNHSVQLFNAGNEKLVESLQRVEGSISQSTARSDEQLAYYVAQAREVIDLSISAQQGIVEDLRQLRSQPATAEALG